MFDDYPETLVVDGFRSFRVDGMVAESGRVLAYGKCISHPANAAQGTS